MNLEEFISEALGQIVRGVSSARKAAGEAGAEISPSLKGEDKGRLQSSNGKNVVLVSFDIAVTAESGTDTKGGIGVVSGIFNLGSSGASTKSEATVSRVAFTVPVGLPGHGKS